MERSDMMAEKPRLLCIAPYENMSAVMKTVAEEFPVELTVYVGDLEAGLELALRDFHNDYDAVISRGGTAAMLRRRLTLPVVEIPVTMVEIVRAIHLAGNLSQPIAVVGHPNITERAKNIQNLLHIPVAAFPIEGADQARQQLEGLGDRRYTLLCDMVAYRMAQELGVSAILITSAPDSVRAAFQEALRICDNCRRLQEENRFLRRLVWNQVNSTVVFTPSGELFFSTVPDGQTVWQLVKYREHAVVRVFEEDIPPLASLSFDDRYLAGHFERRRLVGRELLGGVDDRLDASLYRLRPARGCPERERRRQRDERKLPSSHFLLLLFERFTDARMLMQTAMRRRASPRPAFHC